MYLQAPERLNEALTQNNVSAFESLIEILMEECE